MTQLNPARHAPVLPVGSLRGRLASWMRRSVIALLVLAIGGLAGVNLILMLPFVKHRLESSVSKVAGVTIEIGRITWTPWAGFQAHSVRVAAVEEAKAVADVPFFESETAWIRVRFLPLFRGILEISEMGLDSPRIACVRGADGRFLLPLSGGFSASTDALLNTTVVSGNGDVPAGGSEKVRVDDPKQGEQDDIGDQTKVVEVSPPQTRKPDDKSSANSERSSKQAPPRRSLQVRLEDIVIREGNVTLLGDSAGKGIGELRDFQMRLNVGTSEKGTFRASGATLLGTLDFSEISGTVSASPSGFEFRDLVSTWDGGRIVGSVDLGLSRPGIPFGVSLRTEGLKPASFLKPTRSTDASIRSVMETEVTVQLQVQGFARVLNTVVGSVQVDGLSIPIAAVLPNASLDTGLANDGAGTLEFEIAKVLFRLRDGELVLDDVNFNADRVVVRAAGYASASGALNVTLRAYIPSTAVSSIGAFMRGWPQSRLIHFSALEYTNYIYRDMQVQGAINNPAMNVWNDGTFFTIPALLDEVSRLREAAKPAAVSIDEDQKLIPLPHTRVPEQGTPAGNNG